MAQYLCPLCKQSVSKALYDKITGIWRERQKQLAKIREKQKALQEKEKSMNAKFVKAKKRLAGQYKQQIEKQLAKQEAKFKAQIRNAKQSLKQEKNKLEKQFKDKVSKETSKLLSAERRKQKENERILKAKFEKDAKEKFIKEKSKLQKQQATFKKQQRLQKNRNVRLLKQYKALQTRSEDQLEKADRKIRSLEEQLKKEQTPQVLGLLEEKVFLAKFKEMFPSDKFEHPGKGGDIIHHVYDRKINVGTIVYELKKVSRFDNKHVLQTFKAKNQRDADYGILVTNAKRSKTDSGFTIMRGIIIIHPAGVMVLVSILRDHLIAISKLKLGREERSRMVKAVIEYVGSPNFKNSVETIIRGTIDLYENLKKEVKSHVKHWEFRLDRYRDMNSKAHLIEAKVINLMLAKEKKRLPKPAPIEAIELPKEID